MHEVNIGTLQEESKRLIAKEISILQKVKESPDVLLEEDNGKQSLDLASLPKEVEKLEEERNKLDALELVLAVVGTMKAGKSTTINAIVGMEVLPNRNRPMTALPTLIRHTPGATTPKLTFGNTAPVNDLIKELKQEIGTNPERIMDLEREPSMRDLLKRIRERQAFRSIYEGTDEIFSFLTELNDLVRLSTALNSQFPFDSYSRIENLPAIEVEFTHLREMGEMQGRLTLLDTPGPNEAGQSHLRKMLRDQLRKASAVLAILDYTQLKSDADDEMRENLAEVAKVTGDRLYALVNKFDQKDRNSDSAEQVRQYVARTLMRGGISEERVFPVSSRLGYLASQAKNEILLKGYLPEPKEHPWVEDFAREEFGRRWQEKLQDRKAVEDAAEFLWGESLFDQPLKNVIRQAYSKAALLAIQSSATKLVDIAENTHNFLGMRKQALKLSANEIQQQISHLQRDIDSIQEQENQVSASVNETLNKVHKNITDLGSIAREKAAEAIDTYFEQGKAAQEKEKEKEKEKRRMERQRRKNNISEKSDVAHDDSLPDQKKSSSHYEAPPGDNKKNADDPLASNIFSHFFRKAERLITRPRPEEDMDFDPASPIITLKDRETAEDIAERISRSLDNLFDQIERSLQKGISEQLHNFDKALNTSAKHAEEMIKEIKRETTGFNLIINTPKKQKLDIEISIKDILSDAVLEGKDSELRQRRKTSIWGKLCSWLDTDDWGWEQYSADVVVHRIDINRIQRDVGLELSKLFNRIEKHELKEIKSELDATTKYFFKSLREKIERIRGDLLAGLSDKRKSQDTQNSLVSVLTELAEPVPMLLNDSKELMEHVSEMRGTGGEMA